MPGSGGHGNLLVLLGQHACSSKERVGVVIPAIGFASLTETFAVDLVVEYSSFVQLLSRGRHVMLPLIDWKHVTHAVKMKNEGVKAGAAKEYAHTSEEIAKCSESV